VVVRDAANVDIADLIAAAAFVASDAAFEQLTARAKGEKGEQPEPAEEVSA
jgi:hypothetical protein